MNLKRYQQTCFFVRQRRHLRRSRNEPSGSNSNLLAMDAALWETRQSGTFAVN
jgi:hypothetical protein